MPSPEQYVTMVVIAIVALSAAVITTAIAWRHYVAAFRSVVDWFRTIPERARMRRDPAYRARIMRIAGYESALQILLLFQAQKRRAEQGELRLSEERFDGLLEAFSVAKRETAARIASLSEADALELAEYICGSWLEHARPADVAAFLRAEGTLLSLQPDMVVGHMVRMIRAFGTVTTSDRKTVLTEGDSAVSRSTEDHP